MARRYNIPVFRNISEVRNRNKRAAKYVERRLKLKDWNFTPNRAAYFYEEYLLQQRLKRLTRKGTFYDLVDYPDVPDVIRKKDIERLHNYKPNIYDVPIEPVIEPELVEPEQEIPDESVEAIRYFSDLMDYVLRYSEETLTTATPSQVTEINTTTADLIKELTEILSEEPEDIIGRYLNLKDSNLLAAIEKDIERIFFEYKGWKSPTYTKVVHALRTGSAPHDMSWYSADNDDFEGDYL